MELITIIVPVYNVEKYLNRCVSSIIKQSYINLEIILVDDGSPDKCPQLCDEWAQRDSRIKVVHKKNGGLSDARNAGLKKATGVYVCFVDSDDYVSEKFVKTLFDLICLYKTDISAVSLKEVYTVDFEINISSTIKHIMFEGENALKELFSNNTFANYAWNKMYKRSLFENIEFPVGRKMEDLGTIYKLLAKAGKIAFSTEQLYYYYQREDSILHTPNVSFYKDKFELSLERYVEIEQLYPKMIENNVFFLRVIFETYPILHRVMKDYDWKEAAQDCYSVSKRDLSTKEKIKFYLLRNYSALYCLVANWKKLPYEEGGKLG